MSVGPGRKKAVLMVAYSYYEFDPRIIREAEAAAEAGFDVDFLALRRPDSPPTETVRGVRLIRLNQSKYRGGNVLGYLAAYMEFFVRCFLKISVLFLRQRYAVIHVNNMPDFLVFSAIIPRLFGTKVILDIHDPMPNTFVSKFKRGKKRLIYWVLLWQERLSAGFCHRVITVHEPVKDGILVKHGLAPESIGVIANFPDGEIFPLRKTFRIDGKIRLVFHGTILERSGLGMLMTALAKVRRKDRLYVKIIGEGDFSQSLQQMIQSLKLENIVDFDVCSYQVRSISERIGDCNVGIVPLVISSATDYALPLKLLEYVSLGLPVVTVRSYAISHYFSEEDCIFFQRNDPESLSAALDWIAENPEILLYYRQRAIVLRERFSWAGEKRKYAELLHQISGAA